jgi:putative ABC transport system substrate-binding protein
MERRAFLASTGAVLLAAPLVARAQQSAKMPRVGLLSPGSPSVCTDALRRGLAEQGYVEGRNVSLEPRWAEGDAERLPALAAQLVQAKVAVIVAVISTAAKAAQQATATIPIVMVAVGDPVGLGLVASLARPGGNITGITSFGPELNSKRMQLLKELIPSLKRAAILWTPTNPLHESSVKRTSEAALAVGVQLQPLKATNPDEIKLAIRTATQQHAGALIVLGDLLFLRSAARIAALSLEGRLPTMFPVRESVEAGGLMSYGPKSSVDDVCRRAAIYVDKILKGMKPADLPVEEPSTFELAINTKTARALRLTIPQSLLGRADEVIE